MLSFLFKRMRFIVAIAGAYVNSCSIGLVSFSNMDEGGEPGMARINKVQREVDNVVGVMRNNIDKVLERGEKLEDIENRSGMK